MTTIEGTPYDAVVIGAGAGGMSAAARLVANKRKILMIDSLNRLGGRAGSETIEGFTVNIGAIAIEKGSTFEETFALLGVPLDVREPTPATVFSIEGKIVNITKGGWGMLLGGLTKQAAKIGAKFADARAGELPEEKLSTKEWLSKYTRNETVHGLFRNLCAAIFAANSDELPARAFLVYFAQKGAFKRFGFCPRGTQGLWNDLGDGIRRHGGEIWLETKARGLRIEDGRVTGVEVERGGETVMIPTRAVIGNMGPRAALDLAGAEAFGVQYAEQARSVPRPAANIVINFATRERLVDVPGLITFSGTKRLCNIAEMSAMCPEMAPPGWHLHVAYAVPLPAIGDFDEKAEIEASLRELRENFPGFADAKMLSIRVMRDGWPAQRSCAGYDMPQATPIPNFWHVGDAVKEYGDGGTQACAVTGKRAAAFVAGWLDGEDQAPQAAQ